MSGVGAPATRPRPVARARRGARNRATASPPPGGDDQPPPICLGLGPQLYGPEKAARATAAVICLGLGPQLYGPAL
eukprot:gene21236-biopygen20651